MLYNFSALKTVALNYGVFRRKDFNTTHKYYMFYDMGAHSTTATVVGKLLKILFFSIFCINNLEIWFPSVLEKVLIHIFPANQGQIGHL